MTFNEYLVEVGRQHVLSGGNWRLGQTYFNVLDDHRRDISEAVRATHTDPFYQDQYIPVFLEFVESAWGN